MLPESLFILPFIAISLVPAAAAQSSKSAAKAGASTYTAQCARCHDTGTLPADGRPQDMARPRPYDFTKCSVASAEPDDAWITAVAHGGPAVGLSGDMPAFGDKLTPDDVRAVVDYLRGLCLDRGWPNGNLNLPRPIFTEKAFPEDEIVILPSVSHRRSEPDDGGVKTVFEKRFGKRNNIEVEVPFASVAGDTRQNGFGDLAVALKRVFLSDRAGTRILSAGIEVAFPTGDEARGLGEGVARFEPFAAAALAWPRASLQTTISLELPKDKPWVNRAFGYNAYGGYDATTGPKKWTVGLELNGENRELAVTPQVRKALVKTGALAAAAGVRIPVTERSEQDLRVVGYLLWDYRERIRTPAGGRPGKR